MARFKVFLIGSSHPVDVDLSVNDVAELGELASRVRFIDGHMAVPDDDGLCAGVLLPTYRIQFAVEASS